MLDETGKSKTTVGNVYHSPTVNQPYQDDVMMCVLARLNLKMKPSRDRLDWKTH